MRDLVDWANNKDKIYPVKYATDLYFKFVSIHSFGNGNSRTARLLMNLALIEAGYPAVNVFSDEKYKNKYIDVLANSRLENAREIFENLIGEYAEKALKNHIKILELNEHNIEQARKEINL
ncbi:Fic family protein [Lactobacillus taiwanensis]|uniref:Fic family protein n=1 Tax=Lactobacillus taiwanensis TaxID=508451 RepID=UPI00214C6550|nr:Fic family protein [Lactobacillus taiwanensis]MCR1916036.1 Fic family protein [Lactobacillus taiwanensis]